MEKKTNRRIRNEKKGRFVEFIEKVVKKHVKRNRFNDKVKRKETARTNFE